MLKEIYQKAHCWKHFVYLIMFMTTLSVLFGEANAGETLEKSDNLQVEFSINDKPLLSGFSVKCRLSITYRPDKIEIPKEYFSLDKDDFTKFSGKFPPQTLPFKDSLAPVVIDRDPLQEGKDYNLYGLNVVISETKDGSIRLEISYLVQLLRASVYFQPPSYIFFCPQFPYLDKTTNIWKVFQEIEKAKNVPVGAFGVMVNKDSLGEFKLFSLTEKIIIPEYDWKSNKAANTLILAALGLSVISLLSLRLNSKRARQSLLGDYESWPAEGDINKRLALCLKQAEKKISALDHVITIDNIRQIYDCFSCLSVITKTLLYLKCFRDRRLQCGIKSWTNLDIKKDLKKMFEGGKINQDEYQILDELANNICLIYQQSQTISRDSLLERLEIIKNCLNRLGGGKNEL